jgi:hypothetical protein
VHAVRDEGRKMCLHERVLDNNKGAADSTTDGAESSTCPVALSKKAPSMIQSAASSALVVECEPEEKIL